MSSESPSSRMNYLQTEVNLGVSLFEKNSQASGTMLIFFYITSVAKESHAVCSFLKKAITKSTRMLYSWTASPGRTLDSTDLAPAPDRVSGIIRGLVASQPSPSSMPRILLASCTSFGKRVTRPAWRERR